MPLGEIIEVKLIILLLKNSSRLVFLHQFTCLFAVIVSSVIAWNELGVQWGMRSNLNTVCFIFLFWFFFYNCVSSKVFVDSLAYISWNFTLTSCLGVRYNFDCTWRQHSVWNYDAVNRIWEIPLPMLYLSKFFIYWHAKALLVVVDTC